MSNATMPCVARRCAMRHDPASAAVVIMLRGLKMYGMAQAVGDLIEQGAPAFEPPCRSCPSCSRPRWPNARSLHRLPDQGRPVPGLQGSGRLRLRVQRGQRGHGPPAPSRRVHRWRRQRRADRRPGTGKTHIATALGVQASSITAKRSASSPPSIWSTRSNRKRP
jgi:hypothetical protein